MKPIVYLTTLGLLIFVSACKDDFPEIPAEKITQHTLFSTAVQDEFLLHVHVPESYQSGTDRYPVIYQLDGDYTTNVLVHQVETLVANGHMSPSIIVGIDYTGKNQRIRDYTPVPDDESLQGGGGGKAFYEFLTIELIPFIDTTYRTDLLAGNTLKGHSLGGLITTYALFQHSEHPDAFQRYYIESPSYWWKDGDIFADELALFERSDSLPATAFVSVGELEAPEMNVYFQAMKTKWDSRNYAGFSYQFERLSDEGHSTTYQLDNGLRYLFAN